MARLDPTDFLLRIEQAEAALRQTRARLGLSPEGADERLDPEKTAPVREARAVLDEARLNRDRAAMLREKNYISKMDLDSAVSRLLVAEGRHKATGHLIVSAPAAFGRKHVAPHAPDFLRANPDVRISFNLTDRVVDLVREGYDVGIRIGGAIDPNFVAIRLASNKRVVCGTPAYFAKHGVPRTLDDLARHNCLAFNLQGGQQRGWYFQQNGKAVTVKVNGNLDCNDGELLHRWMGEGLGLGWRSTWEIQPELESGALMTVLDDYALPDYDILAVYPQQRPVPAKIRFFIEHLKSVYGQAGYWSRTG